MCTNDDDNTQIMQFNNFISFKKYLLHTHRHKHWLDPIFNNNFKNKNKRQHTQKKKQTNDRHRKWKCISHNRYRYSRERGLCENLIVLIDSCSSFYIHFRGKKKRKRYTEFRYFYYFVLYSFNKIFNVYIKRIMWQQLNFPYFYERISFENKKKNTRFNSFCIQLKMRFNCHLMIFLFVFGKWNYFIAFFFPEIVLYTIQMPKWNYNFSYTHTFFFLNLIQCDITTMKWVKKWME